MTKKEWWALTKELHAIGVFRQTCVFKLCRNDHFLAVKKYYKVNGEGINNGAVFNWFEEMEYLYE